MCAAATAADKWLTGFGADDAAAGRPLNLNRLDVRPQCLDLLQRWLLARHELPSWKETDLPVSRHLRVYIMTHLRVNERVARRNVQQRQSVEASVPVYTGNGFDQLTQQRQLPRLHNLHGRAPPPRHRGGPAPSWVLGELVQQLGSLGGIVDVELRNFAALIVPDQAVHE